jgi:hypothetical protein
VDQNKKVFLKEFMDCYKNSLGVEGAEQVLRQAIQRAGISYKNDFSKEEALKICQELKQNSGFIGIIGGIMNSRIIIR